MRERPFTELDERSVFEDGEKLVVGNPSQNGERPQHGAQALRLQLGIVAVKTLDSEAVMSTLVNPMDITADTLDGNYEQG